MSSLRPTDTGWMLVTAPRDRPVELLFQQVGRLERIARMPENSGQFSAVVGAITALNRMLALGADQKGFSGLRPNGHCYQR